MNSICNANMQHTLMGLGLDYSHNLNSPLALPSIILTANPVRSSFVCQLPSSICMSLRKIKGSLICCPSAIPARKRSSLPSQCRCSKDPSLSPSAAVSPPIDEERRWFLSFLLAAAAAGACDLSRSDIASAVSTSRRALRAAKIPESDFTTLPNGLKYYDLKVGGGPEAKKGSRVAVHYVAKWKGITFMTSRQGIGVTGGTPYGFDVGQSERGTVRIRLGGPRNGSRWSVGC